MIKMLSALVCASFMMAGVAFAADAPAKKDCGCCKATVKAEKKCEKCAECCKAAAAKGEICKKCHPNGAKKAPAKSS
jgi:hypothetical protein